MVVSSESQTFVIPVVPSLAVQQCEVLSSPVWRLSCNPGREHTVRSPGTQTVAPTESYMRHTSHVFVLESNMGCLHISCEVIIPFSFSVQCVTDLNPSSCCRASRVNSLHITWSHASDDKTPAQVISYHLGCQEGEINYTLTKFHAIM